MFRLRKIFLVPALAFVFALALGGCGAGPAGGLETRTFRLEHVEPGEMASLIEPYILSERGMLQVGAGTTPALTVRERREILHRIGATIPEFDVPQPTVVLHFAVIEADGFEESDPAIAVVESVLRGLFRFKGYRLDAEAVLGGRLMEVRGGAENRSVRLRVTLEDTWHTVLSTELEIPIGQTVVLGTGMATVARSTMILTVRPEIVE